MKFYRCDLCKKEAPCLYDLCTIEKGIISVCPECYYGTRVDTLCSGGMAECVD